MNILSDQGHRIVDVGAHRAVGRHWSGNTHRDLRRFKHCALLHLPDSKFLLGREARQRNFSLGRIWRRLIVRHEMRRLVWFFKLSMKSQTKRRGTAFV
jgi:hypothetical protein